MPPRIPYFGEGIDPELDPAFAKAFAEGQIPVQPARMEQPPDSRIGPFRLNGSGLDSAALAVLQALRSNPQPQGGFGTGLATGLAGGLAGARVRQVGIRKDANDAEHKRVAEDDKARRSLSTSYAVGLAKHRWDLQRDAAKVKTTAPKTPNEAYIRLDTPEKVAAFEGQYPHLKGRVPADGLMPRSSIFPKMTGGSSSSVTSKESGFDADGISDKIFAGEFPPVGTNFSRGQWGVIASSLNARHPKFNLSKAQNAWNATSTSIRSMNGRLQLQLHNSASAVQEVLPTITALIDELDSITPKGNAVPINKIIVGGAQAWGVNGPRAQDIAQKLTTLFQGVGGELANVYNAGGVPSDKALAMSERVLNMNLPAHALKAGLESESGLINVRLNAISNFSPLVPGGTADDYKLNDGADGPSSPAPGAGGNNGRTWVGAQADSLRRRR